MKLIKSAFAQSTSAPAAPLSELQNVFESVIGAILGLAGIVLFLMLIAGGFRYITSGGDPKKAAEARGTLTFAIIGLVVIAGAFLILRLLEEITGAPVTQFKIGP